MQCLCPLDKGKLKGIAEVFKRTETFKKAMSSVRSLDIGGSQSLFICNIGLKRRKHCARFKKDIR